MVGGTTTDAAAPGPSVTAELTSIAHLTCHGCALGSVIFPVGHHRHLATDHQHRHHHRHISPRGVAPNTQKRSDDAVQHNAVQHNAVQHKLNAIADGLADLMKQLSKEHLELGKDLKELRMAVGLEDHESAS